MNALTQVTYRDENSILSTSFAPIYNRWGSSSLHELSSSAYGFHRHRNANTIGWLVPSHW